MVEKFVAVSELHHREGQRALTVTDIQTRGWYDYDAEITKGRRINQWWPADIPHRFSELCIGLRPAARITRLRCRGRQRTDFRWMKGQRACGSFPARTNHHNLADPHSLRQKQAQSGYFLRRAVRLDYRGRVSQSLIKTR